MDKLAGTFSGQSKTILALSLAVLVVLCTFVYYAVQLDKTNQRAHLHEQVLAQAGDLRTRMEYEIHTTLNLTLGSLVYVASHPDITQDEFAQFAKEIMQHAPFIQNLGLAKDNVISHIYPLKGNEKALGLRYLDNPAQAGAVRTAIETGETVIAGPVDLVQGGQGFISRIPIFLNDPDNSYWGISSIVVKVEPFFKQVGVFDVTNTLKIALRGKNSSGAMGEVFYGDARLFDNPDNVTLSIPLPVGSWMLAAAPKLGWVTDRSRSLILYTTGFSIALLISVLINTLMVKNAALKREERKAVLASEHKNRFFTNMTHELRTPLTAIYGSIRLLDSGKVAVHSATWKELFNNAERNCQRLMWIVNDILDLKKLESGKLEYHMAIESIGNIVNDALDEVRQFAEQFHIDITLNNDAIHAMVNADRQRIQQVVVNLLSNAIKFSPADSIVEISIVVKADWVYVEVADRGTGIAKEKMATIFDEFAQAEQSSENARKITASTGLGLSISKQLVEDHGGDIGCYNQNDGGAVFFFKLPVAMIGYGNRHQNQRDDIDASDRIAPEVKIAHYQ